MEMPSDLTSGQFHNFLLTYLACLFSLILRNFFFFSILYYHYYFILLLDILFNNPFDIYGMCVFYKEEIQRQWQRNNINKMIKQVGFKIDLVCGNWNKRKTQNRIAKKKKKFPIFFLFWLQVFCTLWLDVMKSQKLP